MAYEEENTCEGAAASKYLLQALLTCNLECG